MAASGVDVIPRLPGFVFTEKLGRGTYATVYKAYRKGQQREVVAVKCVLKKSLNKISTENLLQEIELLKTLKHEYIVELKDFQWDSNYIYLIMEYCSGGDLSQTIYQRIALPESTVKTFLRQLASALRFLHSKKITHMDLKPQNLLLSNSYNPVLKVADFGFAQNITDEILTDTLRGSPLYMAPEIVTDRKYNAKADLWSVGVIMFECLFGRAPLASRSFTELAEKIRSPKPIEIPTFIATSDSCRDLLSRLLKRDVGERIDFEDFFQHPFIDLEHMPCSESLDKARSLVVSAVQLDQTKQWAEAIRLYLGAMEYFIPAIQYERDPAKKEALKTRASEYMRRAEELKGLLKPKHTPPLPPETNQEEADSSSSTSNQSGLVYDIHLLDKLANGNPDLKVAVKLVKDAGREDSREDYDLALDLYEQAIGRMLPLLQVEQKGRRRDLMLKETDRCVSRAEELKQYLEVKKLKMRRQSSLDNQLQGGELNIKDSCVLQ
ncbi:serine/threonine-protein kinase ULK3-like [Diadema antillarum]|uniref:serine/threonine-protein kinase ULK3-like n=1 Tax=Diadema antillarum TaxID=105358 RepID=UPI003A8AC129